jgi:DNA repair exonuclease SbcCD ATPase subunit
LSGPAVADILSDIGQLDDITQALALVAKDRRTATSTRKVREADLVELGERLTAYADLDSHLQKAKGLQAQGRRIEELSGRVELAGRLIAEVTGSAKILRRVSVAVEAKPPEPRALLDAANGLKGVSALIERWDSRLKATQSLKTATSPRLPDGAHLTELSRRGSRLVAFEASLGERESLVGRLQKVAAHQAPVDATELRALHVRLQKVNSWLERLSTLKDAHSKSGPLQVLSLPDITSSASLARKLSAVARLAAACERLTAEVEDARRQLEECTKQVEGVLAQFSALGLCPTCHRKISPEHRVHA